MPIQLKRPTGVRRQGYTLLELLIVVALLASMAAISVPLLRKPLAKSDPRRAAYELTRSFSESRQLAIQEGVPYEFRYELGGSRFEIRRQGMSRARPLSTSSDPPLPRADVASEPGRELGDTSSEPMAMENTGAVIEGVLPGSTVFAHSLSPDLPSRQRDESRTDAGDLSRLTGQTDYPVEAQWSEPLWFYPNGRSDNRRIVLLGPEHQLVVRVRGLTGAASWDRVEIRSDVIESPAVWEIDEGARK